MLIRILGSAAGGGFPQLNCTCRMCASVRAGRAGFTARTQTSIAASADGKSWMLLNASPDLREQFAATPALAPDAGKGLRNSPLASVVLTNGDVDALAGLLSVREGITFDLYAAPPVLDTLRTNSVFNVLNPDFVRRQPLTYDAPFPAAPGLTVEAFTVPGKTALYLETAAADFGTREGDTIGLALTEFATGKTFFFVPSCAKVDAALTLRLRGAQLVLFDGTLYTDDEMIAQGLSPKTGRRMGHMPMSGTEGSIAALADLGIARKVFVHVNNSNPALDANGPERRAVEKAGWIVAHDGMEITL
jgi:pyrroloquinoline quinone biosynthesis protein B